MRPMHGVQLLRQRAGACIKLLLVLTICSSWTSFAAATEQQPRPTNDLPPATSNGEDLSKVQTSQVLPRAEITFRLSKPPPIPRLERIPLFPPRSPRSPSRPPSPIRSLSRRPPSSPPSSRAPTSQQGSPLPPQSPPPRSPLPRSSPPPPYPNSPPPQPPPPTRSSAPQPPPPDAPPPRPPPLKQPPSPSLLSLRSPPPPVTPSPRRSPFTPPVIGPNPPLPPDTIDEGDGNLHEVPDQPSLPPRRPPSPPRNARQPPPPSGASTAIGRYYNIGSSMLVGTHLIAIPGTDRFMFMERPSGRHPDGSKNVASYMDLPTNTWTHLTSVDLPFCAGHTYLTNGDVLLVGGHQANSGLLEGMKSLRIFNRSCTDTVLRKIRDMGFKRWYPSATLLPNGKVLIMGGTQGVGAGTANNIFWELYDHTTQQVTAYAMRTAYLDSAKQVYYPFNYVLPSGLLFTFCGRTGYILDWTTNTWLQEVPRLRGYANTEYPYTGTSVMLGLYPEKDYQVEIMLFGGTNERAAKDITVEASPYSERLRLSYDASSRNYTFEGWTEEVMIAARVMPDSVLLPNGKVVLLNGGGTGISGDSTATGENRANYPVLFAELYDPDAPLGARFSHLSNTTIPRLYHSAACLTTNGTILVAGCDRCAKIIVEQSVTFEPSPTNNPEYRMEIFYPPYWYKNASKPSILSTQGEAMPYNNRFTLTYSWPAGTAAPSAGSSSPARVVLVAPCSVTHCFNMHQRLVGLKILNVNHVAGGAGGGRGVLTVQGPPNINIAPPGLYMLFLLNGDVYSSAVWVRLYPPLAN